MGISRKFFQVFLLFNIYIQAIAGASHRLPLVHLVCDFLYVFERFCNLQTRDVIKLE
jgi:hypothetical protein